MSTWIAWSPEKPKEKFPSDFLNGDPMDKYQNGIKDEKCPSCGFTVLFMSDKAQYEDWNEQTHKLIANILSTQINIGECPHHNKPRWIK